MKILHCCLANNYLDNHSYQENVLVKMHKLLGHEVEVVASTEVVLNNSEIKYIKPSSYLSEENVIVTRIPYVNWLPLSISLKVRLYTGLKTLLKRFKPDIIFIHGGQFASIKEIGEYVNRNDNVKVYVDNHADFINSGKSWFSRKLLHGIFYKSCLKKIEPYTTKFYGVLPLRVDFLVDVYGIPRKKIELLVMGVDDTKVDFLRKNEIKEEVRKKLKIGKSDFVIITGGKINSRKKIDVLMETVSELNIPDIILIVFGTYSEELENKMKELIKSSNIKYIGWIQSDKVYDYFLASDLAIFPGTHSVLWEQAVGVGLPCIFKRWEGMQHVDLKGNCLFFEEDSEVKDLILYLYHDRNKLLKMKNVAEEKGMYEFSYYEIAKRAIEE